MIGLTGPLELAPTQDYHGQRCKGIAHSGDISVSCLAGRPAMQYDGRDVFRARPVVPDQLGGESRYGSRQDGREGMGLRFLLVD